MKEILRKITKFLFPKYGHYASIILKNRVVNLLKLNKSHHTYFFILSPPYCGSTMLSEIISTSKNVSTNNVFGTREGQTLPTVRKTMFHDQRWNEQLDYDWSLIKKEWLKYWDLRKPILLEKSPSNIFRANSIEEEFKPNLFIIFHRNPYAQCESLIRRDKMQPKLAAELAVKCLKVQQKNIQHLKNTLHLSYESFTSNPEKAKEEIIKMLPELSDIKLNIKLSSHNFSANNNELKNVNSQKISKMMPDEIQEINDVFKHHKALLSDFNYELV